MMQTYEVRPSYIAVALTTNPAESLMTRIMHIFEARVLTNILGRLFTSSLR